MTKIKVLPHETLCPEGAELSAKPGETILDVVLEAGIPLEHACEKSCACTTCHVIVKSGYDSLDPPTEREEDMLDKAWGLAADSRLSCQAVVEDTDLTIEIPKYTLNLARE